MSDADAKPDANVEAAQGAGNERTLDPHVRLALATWPQIDPATEGIVTRIATADRLLSGEMRVSLAAAGLTMEEFKVLMALHAGSRSHGSLCKELGVSTGAMTNRLDKLERGQLVHRSRDPDDRRGVLLALTDDGRARLDAYVQRGAHRERELLGGLGGAEKAQLNALLDRLVAQLQAELGSGDAP